MKLLPATLLGLVIAVLSSCADSPATPGTGIDNPERQLEIEAAERNVEVE